MEARGADWPVGIVPIAESFYRLILLAPCCRDQVSKHIGLSQARTVARKPVLHDYLWLSCATCDERFDGVGKIAHLSCTYRPDSLESSKTAEVVVEEWYGALSHCNPFQAVLLTLDLLQSVPTLHPTWSGPATILTLPLE